MTICRLSSKYKVKMLTKQTFISISGSVKILIIGVVFGASLWMVNPARAASVLHAAPAASGSGDCSDWANACTFATALGNALPGDQIWVKAGVHKPGTLQSDTFTMASGVEIYGGFDGTESVLADRDWEVNLTILSGDIDNNDLTDPSGVVTDTANISGGNSYHVVYAGSTVTETARLDGFVITAGAATGSSPADRGGGIYLVEASPVIQHVRIIGNKASNAGGGVYTESSSPELNSISVQGNSANSGGGMYNNNFSDLTLTEAEFIENHAQNFGGGMYNMMSDPEIVQAILVGNSANYGGAIYNSYSEMSNINVWYIHNSAVYGGGAIYTYFYDPTFVNVVFDGNTAVNGGGIFNDRSDPVLTNVTFTGNAADYGGGIRNDVAYPVLTNVILWGNTATILGDQMHTGQGTPVVSYSLIQGCGGSGLGNWDNSFGTDMGGNIDADPLFVDADGADNMPGTLDDDLRLSPGSPAIDAGDNTAFPGGITEDLNGISRFTDDPYQTDTGNGTPPLVDLGAFEAWHVHYAATISSGDGDCSSWVDACELQTALSQAEYGDKIWVQAGLYKPGTARTHYFVLKSGVEVYGGFIGTETQFNQRDWETNLTVLSGDIEGNDTTDPNGVVTNTANIVGNNSYHVVYSGPGITETTRIDGFWITAGMAGGIEPYYAGGGMYNKESSPNISNLVFIGNYGLGGVSSGAGMGNVNSNPILENVTFTNNRGYIGGGMYNKGSSPILRDVEFINNRANSGAGMDNTQSSSPILEHVLFQENSTTSTSSYGGGMRNEFSSPSLNYVTFVMNTAWSAGGGIYNSNSDLTLTNVAFYGNTAQSGGGLSHSNGVSNDSDVTLVNVVFSGNKTTNSPGGGMYNYRGNFTLTNVTFAHNYAKTLGGGMFNKDCTLVLTNLLMWGNTAGSSGANIYNNGASVTTTYSMIGSADPHFVDYDGLDDVKGTLDDDLRLLPASTAIDAGNNTAVPITVTTDLNGLPRFIDIHFVDDTGNGTAPIVDIGAYEAGFADFALEKVVSAIDILPGGTITFTIELTNTGHHTATQVVLTDTLPTFLQVSDVITRAVALTDTGSILPYVWQVQDLPPGAGGVVTITGVVTVPLASGSFTNDATIKWTDFGYTRVLTSSVIYTITNTAPFFTSFPPITGTQDEIYTYSITTEELNGEVLTITSPTLPLWLGLTDYGDGTALLTGLPSNEDVGDHLVSLLVSDASDLTGSQAFTITVANQNDPPLITSIPFTSATQDLLYTYPITATDPDLIHGDALTITATTLPSWLGFSDHGDGTATLNGVPSNAEVGLHPVVLQVTDTGLLTDTQAFTITVSNINDPPVFTTAPILSADQDIPYTYTISTTDPDLIHGDILTITAPVMPGWLGFMDFGDGTAVLTGTPTNLEVGSHVVVLEVIDTGSLTSTQTFSITVGNLNEPPQFTSSPTISATQGLLYTYPITATDPDLIHGDALTITATTLPSWLGFSDHGDGTATLNGVPSNAEVGLHPVVLQVTDTGLLTDTQAFTITVANINDPPVLTSAPILSADQDIPYTYSISTTDPDLIYGDILTITAPVVPGWLGFMDFGDGTAVLTGTPTNLEVGSHVVVLEVVDTGSLTSTQTFSITVGNLNEPPQFTSSPTISATQELLYTYPITATDPDLIHGDALTITATTLPSWLGFSDHGDGTATLNGVPSNAEVGLHPVVLQVTDTGLLTDTQSFMITVANVNDPPVFTSLPVSHTIQGIPYTYAVTATDPDLIYGDALTITASTLPAWLALIENGDGIAMLSGLPSETEVGDHLVVLNVSDKEGLVDTQSFTIQVAGSGYRLFLPVISGSN